MKIAARKMVEKKTPRLTKGCKKSHLRDVRRGQRLQQAPPVDDSRPTPPPCPLILDQITQQRVLLEIAYRTASLVERNKLIQEKIVALQKETNAFMDNVTHSPENERRYSEHIQIYSDLLKQTQQLQLQHRPLIDCIRFPHMLIPRARFRG